MTHVVSTPSTPHHGLSHGGFVKCSEQTYSCEVTNMSTMGATLHFKHPTELPDRFTLQLTYDGKVTRTCSVVWDDGIKVGVAFEPKI